MIHSATHEVKEWAKANLEHARSRVEFFGSIQEFHRRSKFKDVAWEDKDRLNTKRLAVAEAELERLEKL